MTLSYDFPYRLIVTIANFYFCLFRAVWWSESPEHRKRLEQLDIVWVRENVESYNPYERNERKKSSTRCNLLQRRRSKVQSTTYVETQNFLQI